MCQMYKVSESTINGFDFIVHSIDSVDLAFIYDMLIEDFKQKSIRGNILLDRFTSTNSDKRFISFYFDGNEIIFESKKNIKLPKASEQRISLNKYYYENINQINLSQVPNVLSQLLRKNMLNLI